jgi:hypothetical protein
MAISWSMFTVSLNYSDKRGVITQGGGIVTSEYIVAEVAALEKAGLWTDGDAAY